MTKKILIVGSKGRMGSYLLRRLRSLPEAKEHYIVHGIDIPLETQDLSTACSQTTMILLCVPAHAMSQVLSLLVPHMPKDCILSDITSVKEQPLENMHKHWDGAIVGTHPLFGNNTPKGTDLPVAIVPTHSCNEEQVQWVEQVFLHLKCRVFRCSAQEHDKAMAAIQNLNFITSLAYFAALAQDESLLPFLTPSFIRRQNAAQKLLTEDAPLFAGLYEANEHSQQLVRKYSSFLNIAAGGDIDLLVQRAAWWWE